MAGGGDVVDQPNGLAGDPDRNSGFSAVDPGKLYLPVISSLVYHYNTVNVEAQMATSSSLLHWLRGMLQVRSRHPVFGLGDFLVCPTENEAILSFVRHHEGDRPVGTDAPANETVLCVNNLSSRPQATTVQLPLEYAGAPRRPVRRAGVSQDRGRRKGVGDTGFPGFLLVQGLRGDWAHIFRSPSR